MFIVQSYVACSMIGKKSLRKVPFFAYFEKAFQGIFVDRKDKESTKHAADKLKQVQMDFIAGSNNLIMNVMAEGTQTNGRGIIKMKPGAFLCLTGMQPLVIVPSVSSFSLATGAMNMVVHLLLSLAMIKIEVKLVEVAPIFWVDTMKEDFAHYGESEAEIYAEIVREVIAHFGHFKKVEGAFKNKLEYLSEIKGKEVSNT